MTFTSARNGALLAVLALLLPALPVRADDKPVPEGAGTTPRPGSGGDLKGTTTTGTTLRPGSGGDLKGTTLRGTTMSGTTTRAGSGAGAGLTVATSTPGTPDAAHARAAQAAAGHGANRWWNESYYGGPVVARGGVRILVPATVVEAATVTPAPWPDGTVRPTDRGYVPGASVPATPTSYSQPAAAPTPLPVVEASRTWNASPTYRGTRFQHGSFGGIGTYSGYETWGPVGIATGCDCR